MKKVVVIFILLFFLLPIFQLIAAEEQPVGGGGQAYLDSKELEKELIKETPVLEQGNLVAIIFRLIQYLLMFLGVVAMIVILYAGFMWMTAAGNDEKVSKAKKTLTAGLIGLVIILLAFAIASFVINRIHDFSAVPKDEGSI